MYEVGSQIQPLNQSFAGAGSWFQVALGLGLPKFEGEQRVGLFNKLCSPFGYRLFYFAHLIFRGTKMGSHFGNYPHETARAYRCASWLAVIPNVVWFSVRPLLLVVVASLPLLGSSRMNMQHGFNNPKP